MWALRTAPRIVFLAIAPAISVSTLLVMGVTSRARPLDFFTFWHAGRAVAEGSSPYPSPAALPHVAERMSFSPFVYPPPAAAALVPFGLLPFTVAAALWFVLSVGAIAAALRLLGVRDWRCYGAALVSLPVASALGSGAFGPFLLLGLAVAWRWRDRVAVAGVAVAAVVVAKLFLWPIWFWLVLTRRFRAAALSAAAGAAATALAWWAIGFHGLLAYPTLLGRLTSLVGPNSFSLYALGVPQGVCVGAALCALVLAWRRSDETVLVAALAAALVSTPILWAHYLVVLFVPLALASPRFSPVWCVPSVLWLDSAPWSYGRAAHILPDLAVAAAALAAPLLARYARSASSTSSAWVSGFTLCITRLTVPSSPITNVERSTPM